MFRSIALTLLSLPLVASCTATEIVEDDLAGELPTEGEAGKADGADTFTYYTITRDFRRCVSPMCGGFWVTRSNRAETVCANGAKADTCYVAELDDANLGLAEKDLTALRDAIEHGGAIVRGDLLPQTYGDFGNLGRFHVTEAWTAGAANGVIDGVFVKVEQSGIRCIAAPCEDKAELKLNSTRSAMIADLDFEPSGATEDEIAKAWDSLTAEGGGLIVVGDRYTVRENGRKAKGRTVSQFFTKLVPGAGGDPTQGEGECFVGGCSGQVCSDRDDVITTCEWREEYACYQTATCERQADGACGWTQTEELQACLSGAAN